jgi:PKD repeat protein/DNA-binding MarR family transcriptional regulator
VAAALLAIGSMLGSVLPLVGAAGGHPMPTSCGYTVDVTATPSTGSAPLLVRLSATVSGGIPTAYDWAFGDGSYWNSSQAGAESPLHRYATPGAYNVSVLVIEPSCEVTGGVTLVATPSPLTIALSATPTSGVAPLTVEFVATVAGGSGTYASVFWSFGDGGVGAGVAVNYTYVRTGTYTVSVNVTDSEGHWATAHETIGVQDGSTAPSAGFGGADDLVLTVAAGAALAFLAVGLAWRIAVRARERAGTTPIRTAAGEAGGSSSGEPSRPSGPSGASPALAGAAGPAVPASRATGNSPQADPRVVPDPRGLQLTQRVILHIGAQGRLSPDDVAPPGLTQAGIADALGTGQNSVTNVLRRLVAAGVVVHDVRHVSGQPRRLRVYRFTDRGESVYRDLWNRSNARGEEQAGPPGGTSP